MKKRKALKIISLIIAIPVIMAIILVSYHRISLWIEGRIYPPIGKSVNVNGHNMHIYSEGRGSKTLVFLSGSGTASPSLDFKALYSKLTEQYHIVVVERPGYGFSDTTDEPRDTDTVLEETRTALALAGESGPYILFAHSLSGIEALYWAQRYPEEIKAIVGLEAAVPPLYLSWGE